MHTLPGKWHRLCTLFLGGGLHIIMFFSNLMPNIRTIMIMKWRRGNPELTYLFLSAITGYNYFRVRHTVLSIRAGQTRVRISARALTMVLHARWDSLDLLLWTARSRWRLDGHGLSVHSHVFTYYATCKCKPASYSPIIGQCCFNREICLLYYNQNFVKRYVNYVDQEKGGLSIEIAHTDIEMFR